MAHSQQYRQLPARFSCRLTVPLLGRKWCPQGCHNELELLTQHPDSEALRPPDFGQEASGKEVAALGFPIVKHGQPGKWVAGQDAGFG